MRSYTLHLVRAGLAMAICLLAACGSSPVTPPPFGGGADGAADAPEDGSESDPIDDDGSPGGGGEAPGDGANDPTPVVPPTAIHIPPSEQPVGDPARGYDYLVNGDYQTLGAAWKGFEATMTPLEPRDALPGRRGDNAKTSYMFNVVTDPDGVRVAAPNCVACHATHLMGELIVGLGRPNNMIQLRSSGMSLNVLGILAGDLGNAGVNVVFTTRLLRAVLYGVMDVFPELASHHDPVTLEWTETPLFNADSGLVGWADIPPWWRTKKKNGLYATGAGRGEQGRHMSFMSVFSVRDTAEATVIEENFVDVAAFIRSIEPPAFPGPIDQERAAVGQQVFETNCAMCHGTYGGDWTYPNLVIPAEEVGTDPSLAVDNWFVDEAIDWYKDSFYAGGGKAWVEQTGGYYAPPLDGIWATAPFFHNGSVPTLDGVIDPEKRPATWTSNMGDDDYDLEHVGWQNKPFDVDLSFNLGVFDASRPGNSNQGHTYGAHLNEDEQSALLEYLKTL